MVWMIALGGLAAGLVLGYLLASRKASDSSKVSELEDRVQELQRNHAIYREEVSDHFNTTAELVQQMTDSYKDVYQHLANGAQGLCSEDVANKLLPTSTDNGFGLSAPEEDNDDSMQAPKDYAPRQDPNQVGALAEDFGIEKIKETDKDQ
ncbi:MAG: DUF1043 family protein [Pseudohongiellaceae bacterium]|nr:DUF1043 family protein [Pseudohongiellaceae bacterium]